MRKKSKSLPTPKNQKENHFKQMMNEMPVENHETAAWANIEELKGTGRVFNPNYLGAEQAKEYVDENQK